MVSLFALKHSASILEYGRSLCWISLLRQCLLCAATAGESACNNSGYPGLSLNREAWIFVLLPSQQAPSHKDKDNNDQDDRDDTTRIPSQMVVEPNPNNLISALSSALNPKP